MSENNFDRLIKSRLALAKVRPTATNCGLLSEAAVKKAGVAGVLLAMTDDEVLGLLKAKRSKTKAGATICFKVLGGTEEDVAKLVLLFDGLSVSDVVRIALHEAARDIRRTAILPQLPPQAQVDEIIQGVTGFVKVFEDALKGFWAFDIPVDQTEKGALAGRVRAEITAVVGQIRPHLDGARIVLALISGLKLMDGVAISHLMDSADSLVEMRNEVLSTIDERVASDPSVSAPALRDAADSYLPLIRLLYWAGLLGTSDPEIPNIRGDRG